MPLHVVRHPLVDDVLASLRDKTTPSDEFRRLARRLSLLVIAEATKDLPVAESTVETPLETAAVRRLSTRVVAVPVLRAGLAMLDGFLELVPSAEVGYFGLECNEQTAVARRYHETVPKKLGGAVVYLLHPRRATGGADVLAVDGLKGLGARRIGLLSVVAAPEGIAHLEDSAPDAVVYAAALDRGLNDRKFIIPGLGDFGDRLFGT